jgi:hypothetical protein
MLLSSVIAIYSGNKLENLQTQIRPIAWTM